MGNLNPYHRVVHGKVRRGFEALNRRDPTAITSLLRADVRYTFSGDHALGGTRVSKAGVEKWFGRLLRLLQSTFTLHEVRAVGWPWQTKVYVQFEDAVTTAAGDAYVNQGFQVIALSWGAVTRIHTYVDTARLSAALAKLAARGVAEAEAPQILE